MECVGFARLSKWSKDDEDTHNIEFGDASFDNERYVRINQYPLLEDSKNNYEIELWSGLYDKNKTKIYEGDIVAHKGGCKLSISLHTLEGCRVSPIGFILDLRKFEKFAHSFYIGKVIEEWEVIGNIHENKELLEAKDI